MRKTKQKKKRIKKDARKILVNFPAKRNSTEECLRCQFRILATLFAFTCASVFQFSQEFPVSLFHNSTSSQEMCIYACVCVCVRFSLLCDLVEDAKSTCWLAPTPCWPDFKHAKPSGGFLQLRTIKKSLLLQTLPPTRNMRYVCVSSSSSGSLHLLSANKYMDTLWHHTYIHLYISSFITDISH